MSRLVQLQIQRVKGKIPKILLGTSPFIGAGQFGERATLYFRRFYDRPENIVKIIRKSIDLGVQGIQLLPYLHVVAAVKLVQKELGTNLSIVSTVRVEDPEGDIEISKELGSIAMLLHAGIADSCNLGVIRELLNEIRRSGSLAGVTTHKPLLTLTWIGKAGLDLDVVMFPFNKIGEFMDSTPERVLEVARKLGAILIGKKILAAGRISPREGIEFAFRSGLDSIAVGVTSEEEAEETFSVANELALRYRR